MAKVQLTSALAALLIACSSSDEPSIEPLIETGRAWLDSAELRRDSIESAVVTTENAYSALRLEKYAREWEDLPIRAPAIQKVKLSDLGSFDASGTRRASGDVSQQWDVEWTHEGLREAGRRALSTYPMRADHRLGWATKSADAAAEAGLWTDADGWVGGLVAARDGDVERLEWSCATCHARVENGALLLGATNDGFDAGGLYRAAGITHKLAEDWRPGTSDPTWDGIDNPSLIPDLRHVRYQSHLHHAATLENSLLALAVRIETLLIVSQGQRFRPPRDLAFAMAYALWTEDVPRQQTTEVFERRCASCHHTDGSVAAPPALESYELHDAITDSPARGTGTLRIPTLAGVSERTVFFHDGSARSIREALDLHPPTFELSDDERETLINSLGRR